MFDIFQNRLEMQGTLETITALRISAGRSTEPIDSDLPVVKDAFGQPLIPGASFKGAMRSRLESFLRGIDTRLAANPTIEEEWAIPDARIKQLRKQHQNSDAALTKAIETETDFVSRVFGAPWLSSKFQVRDLTVQKNTWFGQYQERDGVAIDRDTETASNGKLYDFQVVPAGTVFEFHAVMENAKKAELGLLMIGLHQFEAEQIPLGGGRSRGLGVVRLSVDAMKWIDVTTADDPEKTDPNRLLTYLEKLVSNDATAYEDGNRHRREWTQALLNFLMNQPQPNSTSTPTDSE